MVMNKHKEELTSMALEQIKKCFENNDITYWLEAGTLIGAMLYGDFLPWDADADISYFIDDVHRVHKAIKQLNGFDVYGVFHLKVCAKTGKHLVDIIPSEKYQPFSLMIYKVLDPWLLFFGTFIKRKLFKPLRYFQQYLCYLPVYRRNIFRGFYNELGVFAFTYLHKNIYQIPEYPELYLSNRFDFSKEIRYQHNREKKKAYEEAGL
jgi:hypothetical protein